jgi:hypothetical protein
MDADMEGRGLADGGMDGIRLEGEEVLDRDRLRGLEWERERDRARSRFKLRDRPLGAT